MRKTEDMPGRFSGKVFVITGAGSGIGRATVLRLASEGACTIGVDLVEAGLNQTGEAALAFGAGWKPIVGDVADLQIIDAAIHAAVTEFGGLDGVVNNAAMTGPQKNFEETTIEEFGSVIDVNLRAIWHALKKAREPLKSRGGGAVVNVASMAAIRPNRRLPLYGTSKAGVVGLTLQTALEYAVDNIRVNCVCPGPVKTQMSHTYSSSAEAEEMQRRIARTTALNRYGTPEELAAAIAFLLSADASFITGAVVPVDGGSSVR